MSKDTAPLVETLADFLYTRDWPSETRRNSQRMWEYRCQAAAIINGEAWAIRKAWPEAAYEIKTRSDWGMQPEPMGTPLRVEFTGFAEVGEWKP